MGASRGFSAAGRAGWLASPIWAIGLVLAPLASGCANAVSSRDADGSRGTDVELQGVSSGAPTPKPDTSTAPHPVEADPSSSASWMDVARGTLAFARAERALYSVDGSDRFFIRIQVTSLADKPIAVSFKDYGHTVYPNQWGASDLDHRQAVDERRATFPPRGGPADTALRAAFASGELTPTQPHASVDYYRDFNASTKKDVVAAKGKFVVVSLGGELLVTDGETVEALDPKEPGQADFAVTAADAWRKAPAGALIVKDRP